MFQKCVSCGAVSPDGPDDEDQSSRPTFSVRELRAILHERNELKLKLSKAEEQLQAMQTEPQHDRWVTDILLIYFEIKIKWKSLFAKKNYSFKKVPTTTALG